MFCHIRWHPSLAQVIEPRQKPRVLRNAEGEQTTPSVVAFAPGEAPSQACITVGSAARKCACLQLHILCLVLPRMLTVAAV